MISSEMSVIGTAPEVSRAGPKCLGAEVSGNQAEVCKLSGAIFLNGSDLACHPADRFTFARGLFYCILQKMYSVTQKIPPEDLWQFFQNRWEFFNQILRAYYALLFTLDYEFLFNYLQL